jgi:hypothetical protein
MPTYTTWFVVLLVRHGSKEREVRSPGVSDKFEAQKELDLLSANEKAQTHGPEVGDYRPPAKVVRRARLRIWLSENFRLAGTSTSIPVRSCQISGFSH